jgi:hypothetical protein
MTMKSFKPIRSVAAVIIAALLVAAFPLGALANNSAFCAMGR